MCFTIIIASDFCWGGEQCISSERITGNSDVMNAHSETASATASKLSLLTNVLP